LFLFNSFSSRYIERSFDNDRDEELYLPNDHFLTRGLRQSFFDRYLRHLIAADFPDDDKTDVSIPFERRIKAITKGDPREFMG